LNLIETKFRPYLDSGFIQVIASTSDIYPSMNFALTKRTFNDTVDRVIWRTKQVVDFAFLFSYIKSQAEYHIVVEDDVIVAPQFITAIQDYIDSQRSTRWVALHFSQFLGIGLLFHARELPKISQFLLMFHQDQPVDMLLRKYIQIEVSEITVKYVSDSKSHKTIGSHATKWATYQKQKSHMPKEQGFIYFPIVEVCSKPIYKPISLPDLRIRPDITLSTVCLVWVMWLFWYVALLVVALFA